MFFFSRSGRVCIPVGGTVFVVFVCADLTTSSMGSLFTDAQVEAAREVIIQVDAFSALGQEATTEVRLVHVMSLDTGKIDP